MLPDVLMEHAVRQMAHAQDCLHHQRQALVLVLALVVLVLVVLVLVVLVLVVLVLVVLVLEVLALEAKAQALVVLVA
jgi:hypothetical protein